MPTDDRAPSWGLGEDVRARRFARTQPGREAAEASGGAAPIAVLPRARRQRGAVRRVTWTGPKVTGVALTALVIVAVAYSAYFGGINVLRSDLDRVNTDVNQRVQAQSDDLARLQAKSSDLEAKLAAATTDLGIVRSKLQLQRASLRISQARIHLGAADQTQALKDLNDASLALDAAGALASSDVKNQIGAALQLVKDADTAVRARQDASALLERLTDRLAVLTAD